MEFDALKSLQTRIREATGPDRELDCLIECAIRGGEPYFTSVPLAFCQDWRRKVGTTAFFEVSHFTADPDGLGACVALQREVLPGCEWEREFRQFGIYDIRTSDGSWHEIGHSLKPLANDCLTFLDAICAAKIEELEAEQEKEKADV